MTHIEVLEAIAGCYGRPRYLEIGVGDGGCFRRVAEFCSHATVVGTVHDMIVLDELARSGFDAHTVGSDNFFAVLRGPYDLIFIDGSHWEDQVHRDLVNSLEILAPLGTIAMHDTWAATENEAAQGSDTAYKVAEWLEHHPFFQTYTLPVRPGLTFVRPNASRFQ